MMTKEVIKCCPFCGSHSVEVCRTNPEACWIACDECGAEAQSAKHRKDAVANWNRRHYDDQPAVVNDDMDAAYKLRRVLRP